MLCIQRFLGLRWSLDRQMLSIQWFWRFQAPEKQCFNVAKIAKRFVQQRFGVFLYEKYQKCLRPQHFVDFGRSKTSFLDSQKVAKSLCAKHIFDFGMLRIRKRYAQRHFERFGDAMAKTHHELRQRICKKGAGEIQSWLALAPPPSIVPPSS